MRHSKLAVAVIGATVLLGALVSTAYAGRLSNSTTAVTATWTTLNFTGGFGTIECEISLSGTVVRSTAKTAGATIGAITAGNIPACRRGGMTVLRETLPWTLTYRNFTGTLPNINTVGMNLIGLSFRFREPTFGATCLARSTATSPNILTWNREASGRITSTDMSGSIPCRGAVEVNVGLSGRSSSITATTLTLI